jgi:hypothetical protein
MVRFGLLPWLPSEGQLPHSGQGCRRYRYGMSDLTTLRVRAWAVGAAVRVWTVSGSFD